MEFDDLQSEFVNLRTKFEELEASSRQKILDLEVELKTKQDTINNTNQNRTAPIKNKKLWVHKSKLQEIPIPKGTNKQTNVNISYANT